MVTILTYKKAAIGLSTEQLERLHPKLAALKNKIAVSLSVLLVTRPYMS
jgi:hypothetical protein